MQGFSLIFGSTRVTGSHQLRNSASDPALDGIDTGGAEAGVPGELGRLAELGEGNVSGADKGSISDCTRDSISRGGVARGASADRAKTIAGVSAAAVKTTIPAMPNTARRAQVDHHKKRKLTVIHNFNATTLFPCAR